MKISAPSNYIGENNALNRIAIYCEDVLKKGTVIVMDQFCKENLCEQIEMYLSENHILYTVEVLEGECCMSNIDKVVDQIKRVGASSVIGLGGGKVLDVAKSAGHFTEVSTIIIPTVATTDGACSGLAVIYEEDGRIKEYLKLNRNPEYVIVDYQLIANTPTRFLKAGIGDALSTFFETTSEYKKRVKSVGQGGMSLTAKIMSKSCLEVLLTRGVEALQACDKGEVTEALEEVIEAIFYMSCIGFENGGLGMAHDVANELSKDRRYNYLMHGEKVAFGVNIQLELEKWDEVMREKIKSFCEEIELPVTSEDIELQSEMKNQLIESLSHQYEVGSNEIERVLK